MGYNALANFFPTFAMNPNPQCASATCRKLQAESATEKGEEYRKYTKKKAPEGVTHADNTWGITLEGDSEESGPLSSNASLPSGLGYRYEPTENLEV